jgi:CubicO group peptidase (beta-lactamase class C family)
MYQMFPSDRAGHGTHVHALPPGQPLVLPGQDASAFLASYMDKQHLAGVMVLQQGRVRLQRYALGFGPEQRWESFSVAKSVTSTLLGIALQQGYLRGMDDTLGTYIPELRDSAYAEVTVQQLLTMTSGVHWNEDYADANSDVAQMYRGACVDGRAHILSYLAKQPRQWPAGTHFNYNTAETDLLGILVQRATRRSLAAYLSQTIWQPYGMAADAYWIKDECDGSDTGGSGLSATLGDYARLGQFMLDGGRIAGKPVIAKAWLQGAVRRHASVDEPDRGYGYLWWTDTDGSYAAIGIFGQMVYVDPARQLVIAQAGSWPHAASPALVAARREFVAAIKRAVDAERKPPTH